MLVDDLCAAVPLTGEPRRLVSLVPNLSETLWWWQLADRVVGVTDWCVAPPHAFPTAARVRGTKNPDVRVIIDLAPDLVVANEEENRELDVRRLREAGIAVYVTRARSVSEAAGSLARLAPVVGAGRAGEGLAQAIVRGLDQIRDGHRPLRTFCPIWRDPWMAVGRDTFCGDLLAQVGFEVWPTAADGRYPRVELDEARAADPDVVLLPDEPYAFGPADREDFAGWRARVRQLDGTALTWWGPRTPHALGDLARLARSLRRRGAGRR